MTYLQVILGGDQSFQWAWGGQKFTKFVELVQVYKLSMFPCFIISDAYYLITCLLNSILWPSPRCNEDPVCRNPICIDDKNSNFRKIMMIAEGWPIIYFNLSKNRMKFLQFASYVVL